MTFPFTMRGAVLVSSPTERPGLRPEEALSRLEAALEDQRPTELERHGHELRFRVSIFRFVSNWNLLVPVDRGSFVVSETPDGLRISYDLSFRRTLAIITCGVIYMGWLLIEDGPPKRQWSDVLTELTVMWGLVFGANYLFPAIRFPRFIRRVLAGDY